METQKNQVAERLKQATNILVTVSANPSVDQLAGAIGLTLLLNKLNKHAAAVFSGTIPSTLEFLQPEKTLEKNTDSLRDFIIALDKSKADKLRYKVEDQMVKIFITPYMTSISEKDLEFSQGDFNVEVVLALGVNEQQDLDQAITSHGRILHDATVISINTQAGGSLGSVNWVDESASSLCEMLVSIGLSLKDDVLDAQMATALLTGIVAQTDRFSNEKTSSETMQISAKLMTAGANQQLVASALQPLSSPPAPQPEAHTEPASEHEDIQLPEITDSPESQAPDQSALPEPPPVPEAADGTLQISHGEQEESKAEETPESDVDVQPAGDDIPEPPVEQIHIDAEGTLKPFEELASAPVDKAADSDGPDVPGSRLILEPPTLGGTLTANSKVEELEPSTDILGATNSQGPMLSHDSASEEPEETPQTIPLPPIPSLETPQETLPVPPSVDPPSQTLADLENLVTSARVPEQSDESTNETPPSGTYLNAARDAVSQAMSATSPQILEPVRSLNAQPMDLNLGDMPAVSTSLASAFASTSSAPSLDPQPAPASSESAPLLVPLDPLTHSDDEGEIINLNDPPPVPPPMLPPANQSMAYGQQPLPNAEDDNQEIDPTTAI